MDLKDIRKIYFNHILKSGEYIEDELDECLRFHLHQELEKRIEFFGENFSKLFEIVGDSKNYCQKYNNISSCPHEELMLSYSRIVISEFEKNGKLEDGAI